MNIGNYTNQLSKNEKIISKLFAYIIFFTYLCTINFKSNKINKNGKH